MRPSEEQAHHRERVGLRHDRAHLGRFHRQAEAGIDRPQRCLPLGGGVGDGLAQRRLARWRHQHHRRGLSGNGVALVAAPDFHQRQLVGLQHGVEHLREDAQRVPSAGADVDARVPALEPGDLEPQRDRSRWRQHAGQRAARHRVDPASAPDGELALFLAVEVEQRLRGEPPGLEAVGTGQAGLFVDGDEDLEGRVLEPRGGEHRERRRNPDAVVGPQRRVGGVEEVTHLANGNRILREVVRVAFVLLAHHVDVRLERDGWAALAARGGGLAEEYVAYLVSLDLTAERAALLGDPRGGLSLLLRSAGDCRELEEVAPEELGFECVEEVRHVGPRRVERGMTDPKPSSPRVVVRSNDWGPAHVSSHPYNPASEIHGWLVSREAGLGRIAVNLAWLPPGKESAVYHLHHREEEWLYVLEGQGIVEVDGAELEVRAGDFLGFPPGVAHHLRNGGSTDLMFLEGGEVIADVEVADFPRLARRLVRFGRQVAVYPFGAEVPFLPGERSSRPSWVSRAPRARGCSCGQVSAGSR